MARPEIFRHLGFSLSLTFLFPLLLLTVGCKDISYSGTLSVKADPRNLPRPVVEAAQKHWPRARIESVRRVYKSDSEEDYELTLERDGGRFESVVSKSGVVRSEEPTASPTSRKSPPTRAIPH